MSAMHDDIAERLDRAEPWSRRIAIQLARRNREAAHGLVDAAIRDLDEPIGVPASQTLYEAFPTRLANALHDGLAALMLADLQRVTVDQILCLPNVGGVAITAVRRKLAAAGMRLKGDEPETETKCDDRSTSV